ncbi:uncharacterized protein DUF533 [Aneurinibacillus soli]|uniref:Uncharacterized protein n=1 Tax=Aneurinibacillus soli TaxID=1500254 RepID=A0A0U4WL67_9BACL|nr:DUF533 domain-containing protein [Aneurinibacillus soli]PYE59494.1 uncharacterized protein DUF533 [Aneurinibacillus soli]BAU29176.1 hypothetical protein CB4_03357 [Aneurinibacillus soli]
MHEWADAASHPKLYEIRLLICAAQADGYLDDIEQEKIIRQVNLDIFSVRERQIFHDDLEYPKNPKELASQLCPYITDEEKMMLIRKMFKLVAMEKVMTAEERRMIFTIGRELGIQDEKIEEIEQWIMEGIAWMSRWDSVIGKSQLNIEGST